MLKKQKNIDIEKLAIMIHKGFEETAKNLENLRDEMTIGFNEVDNRFDRLEKTIFLEYKNRIERLEDDVKDLQSDYRQLLGIKKVISH